MGAASLGVSERSLTTRWVWWFLGVVAVVTAAFAMATYALYQADDEPGGFWRSFAPTFYANLSAVGLAAALGIPAALVANRAWSQHQEKERAAQARTQAARALQPVRTEVFSIQARAQQIPLQLQIPLQSQSPGLTGALQPAQLLRMRLDTAAWDELKRGNYLTLAGEYGLDAALVALYQQAKTLNAYVSDWGNMTVRPAPEDVQTTLEPLALLCSIVTAQAAAVAVEIDETLGRLGSKRPEGT